MILSAEEEEEEEEEDVANISYKERTGGKREIMEIISLISGLCVIGGSQEEEDMANGIEETEKIAAKVKNVLLSAAFSCDNNNNAKDDDALSSSKRESKLCAIYPPRRYQYSQQQHQPPSPPMELLFLGSKDWPDTLYAAGALISLRKSRKKHGLTASSSSSSSSSQAKRQRRREKRQQQQHALMDQESKEENEEESCSSRSKHLLSLGHRALRRIPAVSRRLLRRVCDDPAVQGLDALLRHYSVCALFGAYTSKEENIKASIDLRMPSQIFQQLEMPNSSTNFLPSKPFSVGVPGKSADDHPSILVVLADSFHRKLLHLLAQLYSFPSESTSFGRTSEMRDERAHTGLKAVRVTLPEESMKALACLVDNGIDIQDYISSPG
eukprot:jgi/Bigna1/146177/aug1.110_g20885